MWPNEPAEAPLDQEPFLVVQLREDWYHDRESETFRRRSDKDEEEVFEPLAVLPAETRIEPIISQENCAIASPFP